ncbi:MAG: hypothetical protein ABI634_11100 [Acidobacteriota bacterium]
MPSTDSPHVADYRDDPLGYTANPDTHLTSAFSAPASGLNDSPDVWSVVILSSREDVETLASSIDAARAAVAGRHVVIDVMVNGNARLAEQIAARFAAPASASSASATIRVWSLVMPDKANAWNQYVHHVWPGASVTFFVDGYASANVDALDRLADALDSSKRALAAAAVPSVGRSAAALRDLMMKEPQINGSLYALRGETVRALRSEAVRMPIGLYRQDGLLGSALMFGLDPVAHPWDPDHIVVASGASWTRRVESVWNVRDLANNLDRMKRQALGRFEALAIREHFVDLKLAPSRLPETNAAFLSSWMRRHAAKALTTIARYPFALPALVRLRRTAALSVPKKGHPTLMSLIGRPADVPRRHLADDAP